jgi:hypothetical protein
MAKTLISDQIKEVYQKLVFFLTSDNKLYKTTEDGNNNDTLITTIANDLTFSGTSTFSGSIASTLTVGADDTGYDVKFFGDTASQYLLWDASTDDLVASDNSMIRVGDSGDGRFYHDGTDTYLSNHNGDFNILAYTGTMNLATGSSGVAVNIGHTTSETTVNDNLTIVGNVTVGGADSDGTDRRIIFGHSTLKTVMGIDDSADAFVINTDSIFDGTLANNSLSIDSSHNIITAGNLTIAGDLTVGGGDIDLSGEASQITLIDNNATALQIGSSGSLDIIKIATNDGYAFLEVNGDRTNAGLGVASIIVDSNGIMTGNTTDGYVGAIELDPVYTSGSSYTITRHNYIKIDNVGLGENAAVTDACLFSFDANAGSHKAVDSGSAHPDIDTTDAWVKININGTIHYIPAYTDKS